MKKLLLFIALFFIFPSLASAADLEITCNSSGCTNPSTSPIFSPSEIWFPGKSLTKSIRVVNNGGDPLTVTNKTANLSISQNLESVLDININRLLDGSTLYADSLANFYSTSVIPLTTINANSSDEYLYTISMNSEAGNEFQGTSTKFDLLINFSGGSPDNNSQTGGGSSSNNSAPPVCNATTPSQLTNLHITGTGANTVTLAWNPVTPVTHYALIFTRLRDGAKYGSTNIGNVTSYTITNIPGEENYEFEIFGVNDCAPGQSAKISQLVAGGATTGRPAGQGGEVLGVNTASGSGNIEQLPGETPAVLGSNTTTCKDPSWRMSFIIILVALPLLIGKIKKNNFFKNKFIFTLLFLLVAILIDHFYFCSHNTWPLLVIIAYLISTIIFPKH